MIVYAAPVIMPGRYAGRDLNMSKRPDDYQIVRKQPYGIRSIQRAVFDSGRSGTAPSFDYVPCPRHISDDAPRDVLEAAYQAVKREIRNMRKRNGVSNG